MSDEQKEKIRQAKLSKKWKWKLDPITNKRIFYTE
jgi:hypothetical protein